MRFLRSLCASRVVSSSLWLTRSGLTASCVLSAAFAAPPTALAVVPAYSLVGQFALPGGAWDIANDGTIVSVRSTGEIVRQVAPNGASYSPIGSIDPTILPSFGASFLSISPNGSAIAIGDNNKLNRVHLVSSASLSTSAPSPTTFITAPNAGATWSGESTLYVSGSASFSTPALVSRLDLATSSATTVISGAGSPGGVAIRNGHLYTADGFNTTSGGQPTGNVRAFDLAALSTATSSSPFTSGTLVADALSGSPLGFDPLGNLLVGGGDFFAGSNDFGYAAVVDGDAILAALLGGPTAPDSSELRLSPAGSNAFYGIRFNTFTNELLVTASGIAYRYAIPAPSSVALLSLTGVFAYRRRR